MPGPAKPKRARASKTSFVPRVVFQAACIAVVPVCAVGCGTSTGPTDAQVAQDNQVISLAVFAFDADASADASGD